MADDVFRRCLHKLRTICSNHSILPSSYTISGDLARVGDYPVAIGGFSEVWKGTYNGRKVCIKLPRIFEKDREDLEKVSVWNCLSFLVHRKMLIVACVDVLQGSDHVEKVGTSKRCCFHRSYASSPAICLGMDAEWDLNRVY